jgi:pimeloyl-ACP methyl ester carboxylesterase
LKFNLHKNDKSIELTDGRVLGYTEFGVPNGKPVFYFHGANSSRLEGRALEPTATKLNVRIISIDRPGFGISHFKPSRQILDWPDDVIAVANKLCIGRFAVIGISAGAAYAAACAFKIPNRLTNVGMVSCEVAYNVSVSAIGKLRAVKMASAFTRRTPLLMRYWMKWSDQIALKFPEVFFSNYKVHLAQPDRAIFNWSSVKRAFINNYLEAHRFGTKGAVWDMALVAREWGFKLADISMRVRLWHGGRDTVSPIAVGRLIASEIPDCVSKFYENEGHLSVLFNHMGEILSVLID